MVPANDTAPVHPGATPSDIAAANARCGLQAPKLPPTRLHDEMYVLRALIGGQASLGTIVDILRPKHFADPANGVVYRWMRMLVRKGLAPADVQNLGETSAFWTDLSREGNTSDHIAVILEHRLPEGAFLDRPVRLAAARILEAYLGRELLAAAADIGESVQRAIADGFKGNEDTRASVCELMAMTEATWHRLALLRGEAMVHD